MTQICHNMPKLNLKLRIKSRVLTLRRCFRCLWDRILICSLRKPVKYRMLTRPASSAASSPAPPSPYGDLEEQAKEIPPPVCRQSHSDKKDSDNLVPLKISMLGDSKVGKTSFLIKYIGDAKDEQEIVQEKGLNLVDKTLFVRGGRARLSYSIWDVDGGEKSPENILLACKDSVAILFMFDLTSRCTLTSVINWYQRARKMNQTAIPIMIGTKFDDFIQLPIDLQWTLASQARAYAKALNATLFFSSAEYNINVNKVFKFITAKLFDLPWTVERNLNIGEPIIDY